MDKISLSWKECSVLSFRASKTHFEFIFHFFSLIVNSQNTGFKPQRSLAAFQRWTEVATELQVKKNLNQRCHNIKVTHFSCLN